MSTLTIPINKSDVVPPDPRLWKVFMVDAFSKVPFRGNPAVVVLCPPNSDASSPYLYLSSGLLELITAEICSVEVAFVIPVCDRNDYSSTVTKSTTSREGCTGTHPRYTVRFFTKKGETAFCGHASFAAGWILFHKTPLTSDTIEFVTKGSGLLKLHKEQLDKESFMTMSLKASPPKVIRDAGILTTLANGFQGTGAAAAFAKSLQLKFPTTQTRPLVSDLLIQPNTGNIILVLSNPHLVRSAQPIAKEMMSSIGLNTSFLKDVKVTRITLMAANTEEEFGNVDFVMRLFAPWLGIEEDALSANTQSSLALYWFNRLKKAHSSQSHIISHQISKRGQPLQLNIRDIQNGTVDVRSACVVMAELNLQHIPNVPLKSSL